VPKAYKIAIAKADTFPNSWPLLYELARYACLLGKRRQAAQYLRRAMAAGGKKAIKLKALEDPDLGALWKEDSAEDR
jgi:hypothetical protein